MSDDWQPEQTPTDDTPTENVNHGDRDDQQIADRGDAAIESALRKVLLVFVFAMLPIIAMLVFLNLNRKNEKPEAVDVVAPTASDTGQAEVPQRD